MQKLAQSWLVYELTGNPYYLGLDAFLGEIPIFLFSILGGVVADRKDRRKVLVVSQLVQMLCAVALALRFAMGGVHVWEILCLSFVTGTAQAFGGPAYQALIPALVKKEDLQNAIAMNSIQFNVARIIGPTLGGLALAKLGAVWCFGLNALSFVAVIVTLLKLQPRPPAATNAKEPVLESMQVGIRFIGGRNEMLALVGLAFLMTMLGIPVMTFLPVFAKDVLQGGSEGFSTLLVVSGVGSVLGGLFVASTSRHPRKGLIALITIAALGVFTLGFALSTNFILSCVFLFLGGAALIACFGLVSSLVQLLTEDSMRGRVMSVYNVAFRGGMPFGSFASGKLIEGFGAPQVVAANGILLVVLSAVYLITQPKVRRL